MMNLQPGDRVALINQTLVHVSRRQRAVDWLRRLLGRPVPDRDPNGIYIVGETRSSK